MKTALFKTIILSFVFAMPVQAMLRPSIKALAEQRTALQMSFLKKFFDATQNVSFIKNVFFVTHQFDDSIVSRRLQELQQCGVPVHVLVSHDLAYDPSSPEWLLNELYASGVWIKVFNRCYDDKIIELDPKDIWSRYSMRSIYPDQKNNMSLLFVERNHASYDTLVLRSGSDITVTSGHRQFKDMHRKISDIFHNEAETEDFKP